LGSLVIDAFSDTSAASLESNGPLEHDDFEIVGSKPVLKIVIGTASVLLKTITIDSSQEFKHNDIRKDFEKELVIDCKMVKFQTNDNGCKEYKYECWESGCSYKYIIGMQLNGQH